jgi:hypothetical protein
MKLSRWVRRPRSLAVSLSITDYLLFPLLFSSFLESGFGRQHTYIVDFGRRSIAIIERHYQGPTRAYF